jgi:hypothetical protein
MENIAFVQATIVTANIEIIFEFSVLLLVFLEQQALNFVVYLIGVRL